MSHPKNISTQNENDRRSWIHSYFYIYIYIKRMPVFAERVGCIASKWHNVLPECVICWNNIVSAIVSAAKTNIRNVAGITTWISMWKLHEYAWENSLNQHGTSVMYYMLYIDMYDNLFKFFSQSISTNIKLLVPKFHWNTS